MVLEYPLVPETQVSLVSKSAQASLALDSPQLSRTLELAQVSRARESPRLSWASESPQLWPVVLSLQPSELRPAWKWGLHRHNQ